MIGLRVLKDGDEFGGFPDGALIVEFTYREAGDDDRDRPRREVTVFAADGDVIDSHDFGQVVRTRVHRHAEWHGALRQGAGWA